MARSLHCVCQKERRQGLTSSCLSCVVTNRLAAGEALAFLNEHWRGSSSEPFDYPEDEAVLVDITIDKLQELAREGSKKMR